MTVNEALDTFDFLSDIHAVGGCVRDSIFGREFDDIDLATSDVPKTVVQKCEKRGVPVKKTGVDHGTVTAVVDGFPFEITTFRKDVSTDGRRATVEFANDISTDLSRRDFTINAMAIDASGNLVDPFGGKENLQNGIVKTVGAPKRRFKEDLLRIVRAARFAGRFGFDIEPETFQMMKRFGPDVSNVVSVERVVMEVKKAFKDKKPSRFLSIMEKVGLLEDFGFPETDVFRKIAIDSAPKRLRMETFLLNAEDPEALGESLKLSNNLVSRVKAFQKGLETIQTSSPNPTPFEVRMLQHRLGDRFKDFKKVICAIRLGDFRWFRDTGVEVDPIVQGKDLIDRGHKPGPKFGEMIERAHSFQLRTGIEDKEVLIEAAEGTL
jgi:poly(A) polymerase/tRNA nucleotidyltransferase (CCA-adding enzyme)